MDTTLYKTLLYDFYGELLPEKQRRAYEMYHLEDLSLSETAESVGISRQGVRDNITRCYKTLEGYEECMGLVADYFSKKDRTERLTAEIDNILSGIKHCERDSNCPFIGDVTGLLAEIKEFLAD